MATGKKQFFNPGQVRKINDPATAAGFDGYVFPYFREMLTADPETPFQHFLMLYHHCLAASAEEAAQSIELLRRGFRFLASTAAGRVIQHIYFGIKLCIEMGGRMSILCDGSEYLGFAIEGKGLSLLHKNRVRHSFPEKDVESSFESLSSHTTALKEMYEAIIAHSRIDGQEENTTIEECKLNPRLLRKLIQDRKPADMQEIREILSEKIGLLRYHQTYWDLTPKAIIKFLRLMTQNADIYDEPMYIHLDVLMNRSSDILKYLSVFGAQAPSFHYGNVIKQISNFGGDDPNLKLVGDKRALPHIPFVKKGLVAAAMDWAKIARTHTISFAGPKKPGPNVAFSDTRARDGVVGGQEFDELYPLLRLWSYSRSNDAGPSSSSKGKKRSDRMDDDDESSVPKKSKVQYTFM
jgi:hypothetical protein